MAEIKLQNISKIYNGTTKAVDDFNLNIKNGEFVVFVGPSGCGKSTTLRMIAGLEEISEGDFLIDEKRMNNVAPKDRDIAMVFQNYALYPHMSVYDNMAFGLKLRKYPKNEINERVMHAASILGLEKYLDRKPKALSGGQRQRVALGRAIVRNAKLFLMDEPLSNLDAKLRVQMRAEITKLHKKLQATTIYVTHDQTEAMTMADKIVVMKDGVVQQIGAPKEIYDNPSNVFVGEFIGSPAMNSLRGTYKDGYFIISGNKFKVTENKKRLLDGRGYNGKNIVLGIRPEDIHDEQIVLDSYKDSTIDLTVDVFELLGAETILYTKLENQNIVARIDSRTAVSNGQSIKLAFDMNKIHFFDFDTELRIQ
ncbi:sn-glycerol-3-phosphate ABC transporter ATP-binding protein UgpC [[Brevibacterium] frigoritolerans]|nr:sn-glycerol-3-phosphate ABC transporter ATP-binding protein UgpC [Peribacillus frigoritolerans]